MTTSIASLLSTALSPTGAVFANQLNEPIVAQATEDTFLVKENSNFEKAIQMLEKNNEVELANDLQEFFEDKTVTPENKDQLVTEFLMYTNSGSLAPSIPGGIQTQSIAGGTAAVLGAIAAAMAVTKGMYEAGQYAARQVDSRGILTKSQYKPNGGLWMTAITVGVGWSAALGFDDYMYGR